LFPTQLNGIMFRRSLFYTLLLTALTLVAAAQTLSLVFFRSAFTGTEVQLQWEVSSEQGLQRFDLYRKLESEPAYTKLATIAPNGSRVYAFEDDNVFRTQLAIQNISYKLGMVTPSGEMPFYTSVMLNPSAVQRSWGSIKSMFR
jgi:hypothetical protein